MSKAHIYAQENHKRFYAQLKELITIPSISTQPQHAADIQRAADWLVTDLHRIGFENVEQVTMPEGRHPSILAEWLGADSDAPTVLIYSHYDVQPAEMKDGWKTPPFEPAECDGRLYARGSTDSKINCMTQIKALESLFAAEGALPVNVKLLLEGEEESGSETLEAFAARHPQRLQADVCVISDGGIVAPEQPSLVLGLRGIVTMEVHVQGPARDLHSGHFGGNTHNPAQALCEIIAELHDDNGTVTVPGFYDDVRTVPPAERELLGAIDRWYNSNWEQTVAAPAVWGEAGYTIHEKAGIRPTLEVNGIHSGYTDVGFKTVLPARALARLSCRLVPHQEPEQIFRLVRDYLHELTSDTIHLEVVQLEAGAPAVRFPHDTRSLRTAAAAYAAAWNRTPIYEVGGGSVPIAHTLAGVCSEMVIMGYGYKGGQNHGPNEHIIIENFPRAISAAITFLENIRKP